MGSAITNLLKGTLGRARPDAEPDMRPSDFQFGEGFTTKSRQSFPSGHTTTAFAAAASVTSEVHRMWPKYTWYVGPALYAGATLVGVSRMYHNRHWASDVVAGAAIGTFTGWKVTRFNHNNPGNRLDRWLLRARPTAGPDGSVALSWTF